MQLGESSQRIRCWLQIDTQCSVKSSAVVGLPFLPSVVDSDLYTPKPRDQIYTCNVLSVSLYLCQWEMKKGPREGEIEPRLYNSFPLDYNRHRIQESHLLLFAHAASRLEMDLERECV